jgi:hypothetical protein
MTLQAKERPIIFKDDMVRAILEGRKTKTRRIMKPQPVIDSDGWFRWDGHKPNSKLGAYASNHIDLQAISIFVGVSCPYGRPGDRLWVRETFMGPLIEEGGDYPNGYWSPEFCEYRADGGAAPEWLDVDGERHQGWKPSIHMPRWASRITLEITDVRVERLQDISEADAKAEGVEPLRGGYWRHYQPGWTQHQLSAKGSFATLWDSINGPGSWEANPWVWAIEFRRVNG